jgi:hypothetical protein
LSWKSDQPGEAIIVHCGDGTVPTENQVGILVTEVLAIVYNPTKRFGSPYEVLALEKIFQNSSFKWNIFWRASLTLLILAKVGNQLRGLDTKKISSENLMVAS